MRACVRVIASLVLVATCASGDYEAGSCAEVDDATLDAAATSFRTHGYAVLPGFATAAEVTGMRSSMRDMVAAWWAEEQAATSQSDNVFTTGENQTAAQAQSRYFFESSDRIHFFREAVAKETEASTSVPPLNKVGHGLHLDPSTPFGAYAQSARVARVARRVAGLRAPVLPQSMYIFKAAKVGGPVTSHQDGTFLYTRPQQTVVGLWLALDDAHEGNGCLWARPGSHLEPLRRKFVRSVGADGEVAMTFVDAPAAADESYLAPRLIGPKPAPPWRWLKAVWTTVQRRLGMGATRRRIARSDTARAWEGVYPRPNTTLDAGAAAELTAQGFVPLPVKAGDLVLFPGTLDHLSLPNLSPHDRHTFQLHMVEGPEGGARWALENWLQYPGGNKDGAEFPRL